MAENDLTIDQLRDDIQRFEDAQALADADEYGAEIEDPSQCYNCGAYAKTYDDHTYICPVCGDEWDIWLDPIEDCY